MFDGQQQQGCCATPTQRWIVAEIVFASLSLVVFSIILFLTTWAGTLFVTFECLMILEMIGLVAVASANQCCCPMQHEKMVAAASLAFVAFSLVAIITWSATIDLAADASCSQKIDCVSASPRGLDCDSPDEQYWLCKEPKASGNDFFFSMWRDDCDTDGGDDDSCRGFASKKACVRYEWPDDDDDDDCAKHGSVVRDAVITIILVLVSFTVMTMIPACGAAISILASDTAKWRPNTILPNAMTPPPLAYCVEIELSQSPQTTTTTTTTTGATTDADAATNTLPVQLDLEDQPAPTM